MNERKLDLITPKNVTLGSYYVESSKKTKGSSGYSKRWDVTLVPCFGETVIQKNNYSKSGNGINIKLHKNVKTLGYTFHVDILSKLGISNYILFTEIEKKYPNIAKILKAKKSKNWFEKANAETIAIREKYKTKVQKQYDELLKIFTEHGSKADLNTMSDINDLYYCEAAGFMDKMEERIFKKNNPKNLKLYNAIQNIRDQDIITCT